MCVFTQDVNRAELFTAGAPAGIWSVVRKNVMNRALGHHRRTSWRWWDEWDDTVLQTQDSKFKPWRSEAEHATFRSRRLTTILSFTSGWGRNIFISSKPSIPGNAPWTLAWQAAVLTTTPTLHALCGTQIWGWWRGWVGGGVIKIWR